MLTRLKISNFKLHKLTEMKLGTLTILTGMNGTGKSSVIQALMTLRQSAFTSMLPVNLNLRGNMCDVGSSDDAESHDLTGESDELNIEMDFKDMKSLNYSFKYEVGGDRDKTYLNGHEEPEMSMQQRKEYSLFNQNCQYISACRLGPQRYYPKDNYTVDHLRQISKKNGQSEYTVNFLSTFGNEDIKIKTLYLEGREAEDYKDYTLATQVERWLGSISPDIKVKIDNVGDDFRLNFEYKKTTVKAINEAFGVPYTLPIIVAVLSSGKDALLMIENPEAHLHPGGQAALMKLLTKAAAEGVQIILETHSDHIINGALVAVKREILNKDDLAICFFERDETSHTAVCHQLEIQDDGRISRPPRGFFDQMDIDLNILTGF